MLRPDCKPVTAKTHQYSKNSFDIIQRVAILAHKGLKDGVNKAEFCFQATNHSVCDSSFFSNGSFQTSNLRIKLFSPASLSGFKYPACISCMTFCALLLFQLILGTQNALTKCFPQQDYADRCQNETTKY